MQRQLIAFIITLLSTITLPAMATDNWGQLYNSIAWVSDARYHGTSRSDGDGALQASVYWWRPDNTYAGVWLTQVDFNDPGETSYEVDIYAGKNFYTEHAKYTVELMYSAFPNNETPGPTYNFYQLKGQVEKTFKALTLTSHISYTPEASYESGVAEVFNAQAQYAFSDQLTAHLQLGRRWIELGFDRSYWELGIDYQWKQMSIGLTYVDTNLSQQKCFFTDNCSATVLGELQFNFY